YTSCWCEENVYLLGKHFAQSIPNFKEEWSAYNTSVLVGLPPSPNQVFLCQARHSTNPNLLRDNFGVIWDYHVILLLKSLKSPGATYIYDFDSRLPLGSLFE
ncbi:9642_t:CDS:2, partial [Acaulospora colombiana]